MVPGAGVNAPAGTVTSPPPAADGLGTGDGCVDTPEAAGTGDGLGTGDGCVGTAGAGVPGEGVWTGGGETLGPEHPAARTRRTTRNAGNTDLIRFRLVVRGKEFFLFLTEFRPAPMRAITCRDLHRMVRGIIVHVFRLIHCAIQFRHGFSLKSITWIVSGSRPNS
jgi:hypothetical protein